METYSSRRSGGGSGWLGIFLLVIGLGLLLQHLNLNLPYWLFSWKTLLITVGLFIGIRSGFQGTGWLIPVLIGGIFLTADFFPWIQWHVYGWPIVLVVMGIFLIIRPRRNRWHDWDDRYNKENIAAGSSSTYSGDNFIDHTAVFGSVEKTILSKDFHGGDLTTFFGGSELNLSQADINGRVKLDVTQIFGGTKLIVPSNWEIKSEMVAIFGGIEDKRPPHTASNPEKVLVLSGTTIFGGIEIVSY